MQAEDRPGFHGYSRTVYLQLCQGGGRTRGPVPLAAKHQTQLKYHSKSSSRRSEVAVKPSTSNRFHRRTPVFSTLWWPHTGDTEGYSRLLSELWETNMLPLGQAALHSLQLSYSPRLTNQYCIFRLSLDATVTSVPPCLTSNDRRWFWATTWAWSNPLKTEDYNRFHSATLR